MTASTSTVALLGDPDGATYRAILQYLGARGLTVVDRAELDAATGQVMPDGAALVGAARERVGAIVAVLDIGAGSAASGYLAGLAHALWAEGTIVLAAARDQVDPIGPLALGLQVVGEESPLVQALDDRLRAAGLELSPGKAALRLAASAPRAGRVAASGETADELKVAASYRKSSWFFQRDGIELLNESEEDLRDVSAVLLGRDAVGVRLLGSPLAVLPAGESVPLLFEPSLPKKVGLRVRVMASGPDGDVRVRDLDVAR